MLTFKLPTRAFSHYVPVAILVFQNNETAAMLVNEADPAEVDQGASDRTFQFLVQIR